MLMRPLRLAGRLTLFGTALLFCATLAAVVSVTETVARRNIGRAPFARTCFGLACRCLGFRVNIRGERPRTTTLIVSNHISWSDIPILGSVVPLRFLSKIEVRHWPVIGWLAEQAGTLFIRRGSGQAGAARDQIARALGGGESVLVFPEGTTSVGITVLPFHSRLLTAAITAGVPIQPISIGYRRGHHPDPLAPFVGDDQFEKHLVRMLKEPAVEVDVILHAPVYLTADEDLQSQTRALHATVQQGLADIHRGTGDTGVQPDCQPSRPHLGGT
ncbi:1-acyl-sn-glycerol-3-phosphate acyltransferase [Marinobacter halodurans]|uniref:1-acyl-sn-glycerol-3-phosphate acyltransferase n=1 Tax=Marinobacter halodurans TaxID=2528979 RepID=A0ABY1ZG57_9GAMM|nr:lysophospholipid acyltransferase family protein [Marinobacter halodurans]TBW49966.1 1-acyl-sn-glycerol-3-phosphate acyltransferase [Marinobacter halodurans]